MHRQNKFSAAIKRFQKIGGVVDYTFFDDVSDGLPGIRLAIAAAISDIDTHLLEQLDPVAVNKEDFLGDWYDLKSKSLIKVGGWTLDTGEDLTNPKLRYLEGKKILGGGSGVGEPGTRLGYAYAFSNPPYGLRSKPSEIEKLFHEILDIIAPEHDHVNILDWTDPCLKELSSYFSAGSDWWGMFLFTVSIPSQKTLCVISASTTN